MPGITNPTEAYFKDGIWGWDGTQWRKLSLVWGFSSRYFEAEKSEDVGAGNITLTFSTVPAGEVWVIQGLTAWSKQADVVRVDFYYYVGGTGERMCIKVLGAAYTTVALDTPVTLSYNDHLAAVFMGCVALNDVYAVAWGYKMKVEE